MSEFTINIPSAEQMDIITNVFMNKNIKVNAVSGAGKSTCVLAMAKFIDKKILQVTYNKSLCAEVRKKAIMAGLPNLKVHTYHSLAVKHYDDLAYMDNRLEMIVAGNWPIRRPEYYDIIVIDEAQDMTADTYQIVRKYIRDAGIAPILVIMGDQYQSVYEFKGANRRFLTMCEYLWERKFIELPLRTSYRVTRPIAEFVNRIMVGQDRIVACKDGPPVEYIVCSAYNAVDRLFNIITTSGYLPGDIFVLLASTKSISHLAPFKKLANLLTSIEWPIHIPQADEMGLGDDIITNKTVFSTFHQSKGRERPIVIIMGFDNSYFKYYNRDSVPTECPATLYVAATRASKRLIIQDSSVTEGILPFLRHYGFEGMSFVNIYGKVAVPKIVSGEVGDNRISVVNLVRFLRPDIVTKINELLVGMFVLVRPAGVSAPLRSVVNKEEVSDINGLVIPFIHEYLLRGRATVLEYIKNQLDGVDMSAESIDSASVLAELQKHKLNFSPVVPADFIKSAMIYHMLTSGLTFKLAQVGVTDWLSADDINICLTNMNIIDPIAYECEIIHTYKSVKYGSIHLAGRLDVIDRNFIYELKCVDTITIEHRLQLLIYSIMCGDRGYRLLNIKNGECWELSRNRPAITSVFELILENRFMSGEILADDKFIQFIKLKNLEMDLLSL
jgi:hypothetical protein